MSTIKRFSFPTMMEPTAVVDLTVANGTRLEEGEIALTDGLTVDAVGKPAKATLLHEREVHGASMMVRTPVVHGSGVSLGPSCGYPTCMISSRSMSRR